MAQVKESKKIQMLRILEGALRSAGEAAMPPRQLQQRHALSEQIAARKGQELLTQERSAQQQSQFESGQALSEKHYNLDMKRFQETGRMRKVMEDLTERRFGLSLRDMNIREQASALNTLLGELELEHGRAMNPMIREQTRKLIDLIGPEFDLKKRQVGLQEQGLWADTVTETEIGGLPFQTQTQRRVPVSKEERIQRAKDISEPKPVPTPGTAQPGAEQSAELEPIIAAVRGFKQQGYSVDAIRQSLINAKVPLELHEYILRQAGLEPTQAKPTKAEPKKTSMAERISAVKQAQNMVRRSPAGQYWFPDNR